MKEEKYTPGPWKVAGPVGAAIWITDESSNNQIAMVYGERQIKEGKANASLIAAAPDLLESLKEAVKDCRCSIAERISGHLPDCFVPSALEAIQKAKGRAS